MKSQARVTHQVQDAISTCHGAAEGYQRMAGWVRVEERESEEGVVELHARKMYGM
jgi:hypothetical protein